MVGIDSSVGPNSCTDRTRGRDHLNPFHYVM